MLQHNCLPSQRCEYWQNRMLNVLQFAIKDRWQQDGKNEGHITGLKLIFSHNAETCLTVKHELAPAVIRSLH